MRIIIGAANFSSKYGINNSKLPSIYEIKKILTYCKKKKLILLMMQFPIKIQVQFLKKLTQKNSNLFLKLDYQKIINQLKI